MDEITAEADEGTQIDKRDLILAQNVPIYTVSSTNYLQIVGALEESKGSMPVFSDIPHFLHLYHFEYSKY